MDIPADLYDCLIPAGVNDQGEEQYTIDLDILEKNHPSEFKAYMTYVYSVIDANLEDGTLKMYIDTTEDGHTVNYD